MRVVVSREKGSKRTIYGLIAAAPEKGSSLLTVALVRTCSIIIPIARTEYGLLELELDREPHRFIFCLNSTHNGSGSNPVAQDFEPDRVDTCMKSSGAWRMRRGRGSRMVLAGTV